MAKKEKASEQLKPVSIETAKLIQGMSLVFSGAVKMLEAIEPHVKIDPGFALNLITGNIPGLEELGRELIKEEAEEADAVDKPAVETETPETQVEQDKTETAEASEKADKPAAAASTVTLNDITRIIVRKIKQSKGNNEKIGQILKTYGVEKVSNLKPEQYEAFVTDLAAI